MGDQRYATWYEPFDEREKIRAAVSWALSQEEITGLPTVGDVGLLPLMIEAERERMPLEEALSGAAGYSSPFISVPF